MLAACYRYNDNKERVAVTAAVIFSSDVGNLLHVFNNERRVAVICIATVLPGLCAASPLQVSNEATMDLTHSDYSSLGVGSLLQV